MSDENYVYLLQEREFVRMKENIYKIGMSKQINNRLKSKDYKDCANLSVWPCIDCETLEKTIIRVFTRKFILRKNFGAEYFEGDYNEMRRTINKIVDDELNAISGNNTSTYELKVEAENEKLRKKIDTLAQENRKLNTKVCSLELEQKAMLHANESRKYSDVNMAVNEISYYKNKIPRLEQENRILTRTSIENAALIKKLNNDIENYKNKYENLYEDYFTLETERDELDAKANDTIVKYKNKLENIEEEYDSKIEELEKEKESLSNDLNKIRSIVCK